LSTKIDWCDEVWNPTTGCTKGCSYCYARPFAERMKNHPNAKIAHKYRNGFEPTFHPESLDIPGKWKKPRRVFVDSMGDLFDPEIPTIFRNRVLSMISLYDDHTFMILTKQPALMKAHFDLLYSAHFSTVPMHNLWLGVSITDQKEADALIPELIQTTAAKKFISIEPMRGAVDLTRVEWPNKNGHRVDVLRGGYWSGGPFGFVNHSDMKDMGLIDWVICGGMSGPKAEKLKGLWVGCLRDQCKAAVTMNSPLLTAAGVSAAANGGRWRTKRCSVWWTIE